jgi:hypothetical protein
LAEPGLQVSQAGEIKEGFPEGFELNEGEGFNLFVSCGGQFPYFACE